MMTFRLAATLASAIALTACNPSTQTLDGKGQVTLAFQGAQSAGATSRMVTRTASSSLPVTDPAGNTVGSITLSEAWVVIREIELEHEDDIEDDSEDDESLDNSTETETEESFEEEESNEEDEVEFVGPFALDLLSGTTYPALPSIDIAIGKYDDIEIGIDMLDPEDLQGMPNLPQSMAEKLQTYSLYLEGNYTSLDGSSYVGIPVSVSYDLSGEFELSGSDFTNGFMIDDSGINDIIIAFNMMEWFRFDNAINNYDSLSFVSEIEDYGNGDSIVLTSYSDSEIMAVIEANIEDSAEYGEDDDDDGELDEDEDDDEDYTDEDEEDAFEEEE